MSILEDKKEEVEILQESDDTVKPEQAFKLSSYIYLFSIALPIIALDQWTKYLVRTNLTYGQAWSYLPEFKLYFRILHWQNTGAAFGSFQNGNLYIIVLAFVVTGLIIFYFPQVPKEDWALRMALSLQMSGAIGNLLDRLQFGYVIDFISVGNFPVWNVADMAISGGVAVLVVGVLLVEYADYKNRKNLATGDQDAVEEEQVASE